MDVELGANSWEVSIWICCIVWANCIASCILGPCVYTEGAEGLLLSQCIPGKAKKVWKHLKFQNRWFREWSAGGQPVDSRVSKPPVRLISSNLLQASRQATRRSFYKPSVLDKFWKRVQWSSPFGYGRNGCHLIVVQQEVFGELLWAHFGAQIAEVEQTN